MTQNLDRQEIEERLTLIERMIVEGRHATGHWGPVFVLWGVAFFVAFGWHTLGNHNRLAWPVTMIATFVLTRILHRRKRAGLPRTTAARAINSIWIAMVIAMFVLPGAIEYSGSAVAPGVQVAILATMLGMSNAACGLLLRWKQQFACAVIWWAEAVISCFGTARLDTIGFMTASFLCWIVFGIYVIYESHQPRQPEQAHA